jgi:hypothetical protein
MLTGKFRIGDIVEITSNIPFFDNCRHTKYKIIYIDFSARYSHSIKIMGVSDWHIVKDVAEDEIELFLENFEVDL